MGANEVDTEDEARLRALEDRVRDINNLISVGRGVIIAVTSIGAIAMWVWSNMRDLFR